MTSYTVARCRSLYLSAGACVCCACVGALLPDLSVQALAQLASAEPCRLVSLLGRLGLDPLAAGRVVSEVASERDAASHAELAAMREHLGRDAAASWAEAQHARMWRDSDRAYVARVSAQLREQAGAL